MKKPKLKFERLYDPLLTRKSTEEYSYEKLAKWRDKGFSGFADQCFDNSKTVNQEKYAKLLKIDRDHQVTLTESLFGCILSTPNFEVIKVTKCSFHQLKLTS